MKVGIVGPEERKWTYASAEKAIIKIRNICIAEYLNDPFITIVSGHCPKGGVDIWAEEMARKLGIVTAIYPPVCTKPSTHNNKLYHWWNYHFKPRNMQIAEASDILYCLVPFNPKAFCKHHKTYGHPSNGGCWTLLYAKNLGKTAHLVVIK